MNQAANNPASERPTREQARARYAWKVVKSQNEASLKDFAGLCKQTASRILNSGLGGALAFSISKKKDDTHRAVLGALAGRLLPLLNGSGDDAKTYLEKLMSSDAITLRQHTEEALALLVWLARLADGLKVEEGEI